MANEKISQFAIDADIEDIDGLAAMTITNAGTADPAGGIPIEYGNVAVPGYAFTLGNILKAKENRSDPDPANWSDVASNVISTSGTAPAPVSEGIMWKRATGEDLVQMVVESGNTLKFANHYSMGQNRHGIMFDQNSNFTVNQAGNNSSISLTNTRTSAGDAVRIQSGQDTAINDIGLLLNARGEGSKLKLFSGKDVIITSGKGLSAQQAGDVILTLGTTTPTANQLLASSDANGTLTWQDESTYNLITALQSPFNGSVSVGLVKDATTTPTIVSSITFNEDKGIEFTSPIGAQTASFGVKAKLNTAGGLKFSASDEIELDLGYTQTGKNYAVQLDNNKLYVNVPWTDTDTTYSAATETTAGLLKLGDNTVLTATYETGTDGTGVEFRAYPVQFNSAKQAAVYVPWIDTNTTYGAKSNGGLTLDNNNEFSITAPVPYTLGGTGATANTLNGVVYAGSTAYQTGTNFTFESVNPGTADARSVLSIGLSNSASPDDGFQGVVKVKGQGDSTAAPYDESGKIELECQTGGHNFHIVGPNHSTMSYSPGIILPSNIGKAGQVLVLDTSPTSGSVRTATTKWETPANGKKTFITLSNGSGTNNNWEIGEGYNAKCDFTTTGTSQTLDLATMFAITGAVAGGDYGTLIVINDTTAGTITFPTNSRWVGGGTPTPTDGGVDIYSFIFDGSQFYWTYGLDNKV